MGRILSELNVFNFVPGGHERTRMPNSQPIKTPKGEQTRASILSELGLRPRLFAATVFAIAAAFPVVWFFFIFGGARGSNFESLHFFPVLFFGILPVSAAALCGFTVGSRLADGSE